MARVIIGFLGAALAGLVAGFFVKHTPLPLYISIAFSVAAMALWFYGTARKARQEIDASDTATVEELDADEIAAVEKKAAAEPDETAALEPIADEEFAPPRTRAAQNAKPKPKPKPKAKPKPKPSKPKPSKPKPSKPKPVLKRKPPTKRVAVVPGAERYHKPTCRFAQGAEVRMVSETIATERGYVPCGVCKP